FAELIERLLLRLHAIGALNGAEMLEAVEHDERKKQGDSGSEDAHLVHTHRVSGLDETRVVKVLDEIDFRRADAAAAQGLLRQQQGVVLDDRRGLSAAYIKVGCGACRHGSPQLLAASS